MFNDRDGREWLVRQDDDALTFTSRGERRRLSPAPAAWAELSRGDLTSLLASAEVITFAGGSNLTLLQ
jgi:hypothetical protein